MNNVKFLKGHIVSLKCEYIHATVRGRKKRVDKFVEEPETAHQSKMADDYVYFLRNKFINDFNEAKTKFSDIPLHGDLEEIWNILQKKTNSPAASMVSLKNYLFKLNDLLADCITMAEKKRQPTKALGKKILSSSSSAKDLWGLVRARFRLIEIKRTLERFVDAAAASERAIPCSILVVKPEAFQYVDESEIHGIDDQIKEIQNLLNENKALVGLVGMGGSGKTVLARSVFHSQKMQEQFDLRLWIDLSEATDSQKKYFCILVERFGYIKSPCQYGLDEVLCTLYTYIRNRKCLIVLDGMWHYKEGIKEFIDVIVSSFHGAVIVTSRLLDLAIQLVGQDKLYTMLPLDEKATWSIFTDSIGRKHLGHVDGADRINIMLEEIKYRCDGVPLAAKTLAEIMLFVISEKRVWAETEQASAIKKKILMRVNVHDRLSLSKAWYRLLKIPGVDVERTLFYKNEFLVTAFCRPHDIELKLGKFCHIEIISVT